MHTLLLLLAILLLWLAACAPTETGDGATSEATSTSTSTPNADSGALSTLPSTKSATVAAPDTATPPATTQPSSSTTVLPTAVATDQATKPAEKTMNEPETPTPTDKEAVESTSAETALTITPLPATQISAPAQPAIPSPAVSIPTGLETLIDQISNDAAQRAGINRAGVTLRSIEGTTWRDGALGCPEEGGMYTQALVDGYRVIVDAKGWNMEYHTSGTTFFKFCDPKTTQPEKPLPPSNGGSTDR